MFTAADARELLEAATPGPWMYDWRGHEDGARGDLWHTGGCGGPLTREADWELAAQAPDLAQTVVDLHAEVERAASAERGRIVAWLRAWADAYQPKYSVYPDDCRDLANRIERGEVTP
jgi:hypothetical protein